MCSISEYNIILYVSISYFNKYILYIYICTLSYHDYIIKQYKLNLKLIFFNYLKIEQNLQYLASSNKMLWEQKAFFFFTGGFFMLSIIKTLDKYRQNKKKTDIDQKDKTLEEKEQSQNKTSSNNDRIKLIKLIINYSAGVNNRYCFAFLICFLSFNYSLIL
jgi:hypothetical protein